MPASSLASASARRPAARRASSPTASSACSRSPSGLAAEPRLLLLDEPASGLNAEESARLLRLILDLKKAGISILLVEHNMEVVMRASDAIVVLHHGEKIAEGTPREISGDRAVIAAYLGQDWMADAVG